MYKGLIVTLSLIVVFLTVTRAQTAYNDSLIRTAHKDAKKFKLNNNEYKLFLKIKPDSSSDLFKPQKAYIADTTLLADSVYIAAFRSAAYAKTMNRRNENRHGNALLASLAAGVVALGIFAGVTTLIRQL